MKLWVEAKEGCSVETIFVSASLRSCSSTYQRPGLSSKCYQAFTLIELIFVLALLVIITSIAVPRMSGFIRGRALESESQRMIALMHAAQSRAASEGMPVVLWINAQAGQYGIEEETTGKNGDAKAEQLTLDGTLKITVSNAGTMTPTTLKGLPVIRFLPDGTVDEGSPQIVQLSDADGFGRWLVELPSRMGYEISDRVE